MAGSWRLALLWPYWGSGWWLLGANMGSWALGWLQEPVTSVSTLTPLAKCSNNTWTACCLVYNYDYGPMAPSKWRDCGIRNAARSCKHWSGKATTCVWQRGVHCLGTLPWQCHKEEAEHWTPSPSHAQTLIWGQGMMCWESLPALLTWNPLFVPRVSAVSDVAWCSNVSPARTTILPVSHEAASPVFTASFPVVTGMLTVNKQAVRTDVTNAVSCSYG